MLSFVGLLSGGHELQLGMHLGPVMSEPTTEGGFWRLREYVACWYHSCRNKILGQCASHDFARSRSCAQAATREEVAGDPSSICVKDVKV